MDRSDHVQAITIRLHDALPQSVVEEWQNELQNRPDTECERELRNRIELYLDAGHGSCWLREPEIGNLVENALLHFDSNRYRLLAWCVMPNRVHVLAEVLASSQLDEIAHSWKSFTAHEANKFLKRTGKFWQREYHDRFIRDGTHFENALRYIENNPVKAGLATRAEDWSFSSARHPRKLPTHPLA